MGRFYHRWEGSLVLPFAFQCHPSHRWGLLPIDEDKPFPYLDGSFLEFGSEEELSRFITYFAKRPISPPRVLPELYLQQKGYHDLDNQLKESGLWPFVSRSRQSFNPAYVRAFYSNLRRDGDTIRSSINLYDIEFDLATFARVAGLPTRGDDIASYRGDDWILNNEAVVIRELGITNLIQLDPSQRRTDDSLGPTREAPPPLHHHPDSSPSGQSGKGSNSGNSSIGGRRRLGTSKALIAMLQAALTQGDMRKELRQNLLSTYQEMLTREKYLALEEDDDEPPVRKDRIEKEELIFIH
ncbi:unnamed protein product [Cuscuta campestris]|uniref:Uncharacterized protein n=1 Tax=Cuscuta campestris TaxID=132261 RepID=A0A484LA56_9ASTE|nr:unnamed protein product [Cuscuta campestris]